MENNAIEEIKKKLDIVEFIGSCITLKKTGRNFKAICPFHQEKTPSFIVSPERQIWHCFGACQEGGDVIKFLMKWENITFFEAVKELAQKTGVVLKKINIQDNLWKKRERYFSMNELAMEFFSFLLSHSYGEKAYHYLRQRGIKDPIIKTFNLGYAPISWDSLKKFLKKKKFEEEEMYENGLLVKTDKGHFYDRFRGRLIFPIKDSRGFVLGFSGRLITSDSKEAKYINTPETPIYHKRETLFGIDLAKEAIKKENNVYIVEGEFDMITPYQFGLNNFVAIKGTALTFEQLMLLKRYTKKIILTLDADEAGVESTKRSIDEAEKLDLEVYVVKNTLGKDPDEAIRKNFIAFKKILHQPLPIYDFLIDEARKKYPENTVFAKKNILNEVLPFIEKIINPVVQSYYLELLANLLQISKESIEKMIKELKRKKQQKQLSFYNLKTKAKEERMIILEKFLLSLILQNNDPFNFFKKVFNELSIDDLSLPSLKKISFLLEKYFKKNQRFIVNDFVLLLDPQLKPVFDEIYLFASFDEKLKEENIEKLILEIKKNSLKRQIKKLLLEKEDEKKREDLLKLNKKLSDLEKRLN